MTPCPHHGPDAVCSECPERHDTDGRGFPHPSVARGGRRLQRCPRCRELTAPEQWVHDVRAVTFACRPCATNQEETTPA